MTSDFENNNVSSVANKYPTYRDNSIKSARRWLAGKRLDDNAEGLWRVHDKLYDLTEFIDRHPGGPDWLSWTKGVDITEQFETHHLTPKASILLEKFYVRDASEPRNYNLTFKDDGFYRTLKRKAVERLKTVDFKPVSKSKYIVDGLAISTILASILAMRFNSYILGIVAGQLISATATAAHNFFHQKDNYRMLYFNLSTLNYREWRITHAMSHHLYTNTFYDFEISMFEPWFDWLPKPKSFLRRLSQFLYFPIIYLMAFYTVIIGRHIELLVYRKQTLYWDDLVPLTIPVSMYLFGGSNSIRDVFLMWNFILLAASFIFAVVGLNAGHHHPESIHEGDELSESMDFGVFQLDAVVDRVDVKKSQFLVLTHFGEHTLHHLFPTLDHGVLPQLYDVFFETCAEFETQLREYPWYKLILGQFQQINKTKPSSRKERQMLYKPNGVKLVNGT